jgi:N-acetyl-alpha-D-glucosaminyl L-malate synthase BshA
MNIGITCYPTFGGSGIIATEVGLELARRGHRVHFICSDMPWRFDRYAPNVFFHEVEARDYPLFEHDPYVLALASKMVEVAQWEKLDLFHVHYAIPHATAAHLAREILGASAPRLVTTLHGTDITVVGNDRSFLPITRFSIAKSDGVTVPSKYLAHATRENLGLPELPIAVISNFVDTDKYSPPPPDAKRLQRIVHNSNFRPLKRVVDVVSVFAEVVRTRACELVLIGDGPERSRVERMVHDLGLSHAVTFLGKRLDFVEVLRESRVFLQPSETESFGLAALEAMACGVPVVASRVGGVPEVVEDGQSGVLCEVGDVAAMAGAVGRLLDDEDGQARMSAAARRIAVERFGKGPMVDAYEAYYRRVISSSASP